MRLYDKNMIEMRDGRKPVISPQLKSVSNYIDVSMVLMLAKSNIANL